MDKQAVTAALAELEAGHQIIKNALNIMTPEQKSAWAQKNEEDGVAGEGVTRANERMTAIHVLNEAHHRDMYSPGAKYIANDGMISDRAQAISGLVDLLRRNEVNRGINNCCQGPRQQTLSDNDADRLFLALDVLAREQQSAIFEGIHVGERRSGGVKP